MTQLYAVRGAHSVIENSGPAIQQSVSELVNALVDANRIRPAQILSVFFTMTSDLTALNPAYAVRQSQPDWDEIPLLCSVEPNVTGMLPLCVRILIQWQDELERSSPVAVYLGKAEQLRPDLVRKPD